MKVAVDHGPLTSGHAGRGVGVYTLELIEELKKLRSKQSLPLRGKELIIDAVDFEKADLGKYDLVHYTYFDPFFITLPLKKPTKVVVTIHDLIPLIYSKHYPPGIKGDFRFLIQKYLVKRVDAIITISETSKKDIVRFLGVPEEKIHVVYLGPRKICKPIKNSDKKEAIRKKYSLPEKFVLFVGELNYNKNILGLIRACKIAKVPLVIVGGQAKDIKSQTVDLSISKGPRDWVRALLNIPHPELAHYKELLKHFQSKQKIICPGYVSGERVVSIYNLAAVYCQPSFYEGFGLPVLEAMACGTPVVAAKTQALVEIAEGAVLFADPKDPEDIARKITEILRSEKTKKELVKKGFERVKEFSWQKTAKETIRVYKQILQK